MFTHCSSKCLIYVDTLREATSLSASERNFSMTWGWKPTCREGFSLVRGVGLLQQWQKGFTQGPRGAQTPPRPEAGLARLAPGS